MTVYTVEERRDGEAEEWLKDGEELAWISYDCPEDQTYFRNLAPLLAELNRLGEIEAKYNEGATA